MKYLPIKRREQYLIVWWSEHRPKEVGCTADGYCRGGENDEVTPWSEPVKMKWREAPYDESYDWEHHKWTHNVPGNRWNTEEDGKMPDPEDQDRYGLNDGDAFDDMVNSHFFCLYVSFLFLGFFSCTCRL